MPTVDITIVTYNSRSYIRPLLNSILEQDADLSDTSIFVADNASTDGSADFFEEALAECRERFHETSMIRVGENMGYGGAQNKAASQGGSPYILILNPDVELSPQCLGTLLSAAREMDWASLWEPRQIPYEHPKAYDPVSMETSWASGAALLIRRSAFEVAGGFDPGIFLYCEDVDLSWRLRALGHRLAYVPKAVLTHRCYSVPDEMKPQQVVNSLLGNLYLRTRFGSAGDVVRGLALYFGVLTRSRAMGLDRRKLLGNLADFARSFARFRRGDWRERFTPEFRDLDYSIRREGAFHRVTPWTALPVRPVVSVLIRTVGRRGLIERALQSVRNQTYPAVEVVVMQDGAPTLDGLSERYPDMNVRCLATGERAGRCAAGNEAMRAASGDFMIFLDEDDEFYADHIEQLVAATIRENNRVAYSLAFEVPTAFSEDGETIVEEGEPFTVFDRPFSYTALSDHNYLPIHTVLFHRSLFIECGGLDPELDNLEDWDLWVRYSSANGPFAFVRKTTALYRVPFLPEEREERHERLKEYYEIAKPKHDRLPVKADFHQMAVEYEFMREDFARMADLDGTNPLVVHHMLERHGWLRGIFRFARGMLRPFIG